MRLATSSVAVLVFLWTGIAPSWLNAQGADTEPPATPDNLTSYQTGAGTVWLQWGLVTDNIGVVRYDIQRSASQFGTEPTYEKIGSLEGGEIAEHTDTSGGGGDEQPIETFIWFEETGVGIGSYVYVVQAFDAAGNASALSAPVSVGVAGWDPECGLCAQDDTPSGGGCRGRSSSGWLSAFTACLLIGFARFRLISQGERSEKEA
ncbi:MAG TPA: hypothetical protein VI895_12945 [Bdellovibrionota bacterium]|nr:hypothetical protein [Bdellovibrionota bacterium]